jgi:hypothetical protein
MLGSLGNVSPGLYRLGHVRSDYVILSHVRPG